MSTIIERFLIPLFVVVSVLYAYNSFGSNSIEMNKVYHHTTDNPMHLERAHLSFYFSGDPQVQEIKNKKSDIDMPSAFFFPHTIIKKGECEAMVKRVNEYNNGYTITIEHVLRPVRGIQLVFNIDADKFAISYERFDSIGLHKGIVFRLYDKNVLGRLEQAHQQPVLRTLWQTGRPRIAIDPGHGGIDSGAIGCAGVQEKDICLAISTMVSDLLQSQGCDVLLTRNNDSTVLLDERTAYANNNNADLFVSIHANYANNARVCGVETFCLHSPLFSNGYYGMSGVEKNYIVDHFNRRAAVSNGLAQCVQHGVCDAIAHYHDVPIDRKVKFSVAQVLLGTLCPSVLVEVGFVSHDKESLLLASKTYQNSIARGICKGILTAIAS